MKEYQFGPEYLSPTHFMFTEDYYIALSNKITILDLHTQEITEIGEKPDAVPVFVKISQEQHISERLPKIYIFYSDDKAYIVEKLREEYDQSDKPLFEFMEVEKRDIFSCIKCEDYYSSVGDYFLSSKGALYYKNNLVFDAKCYPVTQIMAYHDFAAAAFSNNEIICTTGEEYQLLQNKESDDNVAIVEDKKTVLKIQTADNEFCISAFEFYQQYLIAMLNSGIIVTFDTETKELTARHELQCPNLQKSVTGENLCENFIFPLFFNIKQVDKYIDLQVYLCEYPVKNTYVMTTKYAELELELDNLSSIDYEINSEFILFNPVTKELVENPDYYCGNCNYGYYKKDISNWKCINCGSKLLENEE